MDPDMVRQQEEAEAASRLPQQPPEEAPHLAAVSPVAGRVTLVAGARSSPPAGAAAPPQREKAGKAGVLFAALLVAALTVIGLSQGLQFGEGLALVPWQTLAAGALGGIGLGWGGTALWLRLRYGFTSAGAAGTAILPTVMVLAVMLAAMKLADQFAVVAPPALIEALEDYHAGVLILAGGAVLAYLLALGRMWRTLRG